MRERRFPRWYLLAGAIGAVFVLAQTLTVALLGVALFTVAAVDRPDAQRPVVDRLGMGPGREEALTGDACARRGAHHRRRRLGRFAALQPAGTGAGAGWLLPVLLPLAGRAS